MHTWYVSYFILYCVLYIVKQAKISFYMYFWCKNIRVHFDYFQGKQIGKRERKPKVHFDGNNLGKLKEEKTHNKQHKKPKSKCILLVSFCYITLDSCRNIFFLFLYCFLEIQNVINVASSQEASWEVNSLDFIMSLIFCWTF